MEWSGEQNSALKRVSKWLEQDDQQVFRLYGYAGTGKTTLARHLAEGASGAVYFATFTGKAAHVLASKGCPNACTIHSLIYQPKNKSENHLRKLQEQLAQERARVPHVPAKVLELERMVRLELDNLSRPAFNLNLESVLKDAALLIVDECSMIGEQMGRDLVSFGCKILALGDPGQLPPIEGKSFFGDQPDFMLEEIHRQARDNPIIQLATLARQRKPLRPGRYGSSAVYARGELAREELGEIAQRAGQILVGRNNTRQGVNARMRELRGYVDPLPMAGDKLVCLRNNHEIGLLNGQLWECRESSLVAGDQVVLKLRDDQGANLDTMAHKCYFLGGKPEWYEKKDAEEFDYGYALTVHKAQGSQWDSVLLLDEWNRDGREKWLYTGITRAAESLTVVQM